MPCYRIAHQEILEVHLQTSVELGLEVGLRMKLCERRKTTVSKVTI